MPLPLPPACRYRGFCYPVVVPLLCCSCLSCWCYWMPPHACTRVPHSPQGIDRSTAQRIMSVWRTSGAADPDGLRKLFLKRSLNRSTQIGLQLLVDGGAGAAAYYAASSITPDELGTWTLAAKCAEHGEGWWVDGDWVLYLPEVSSPTHRCLTTALLASLPNTTCQVWSLLPGHVPVHRSLL